MDNPNQPDLDLDELKARIREQASSMRERAAASIPLAARGASVWTFNWLEVKARLKIGAGLAQLGAVPLLPRFHGMQRRLALAASRVILFLTRFLTSRQTDFNVCLLDALREMGEALHSVETRVVQQQEQIRLLEATISQLQLRVGGSGSALRGELERKAS
ncbi:MAG TPA: hypothetical protein VMG10_01615 [Gemmataceae bacterium]|nr:hypothetical protein [Gemmataceae bacterium]